MIRRILNAMFGPPRKPPHELMAEMFEARERWAAIHREFNRCTQEMEDAKPGPKSLYDPLPPPPYHCGPLRSDG